MGLGGGALSRALLILLVLVAVDAGPDVTVSNGGFEDGLHGWDIHCALERCAEATTEHYAEGDGGAARGGSSGAQVASLRGSADEWTAVALRQQITGPFTSGPLVAEASVRSRPPASVSDAALELRLAIVYEDAKGALLGSCAEQRDRLPSDWERLRVRCSPPTAGVAARVLVLIEFACVRGTAALLADNVSVRSALDEAAAAGGSAPVAALPAARIPRVVHFIFGLSADFGGKPFALVHHVVIKAAIHAIKPDVVYFHHAHEPRGEWWDQTRPLLALRRIKPPNSIFGKPVRRFAHQADVIRLELLLQFGGIYLDLDVLLVRALTDDLFLSPEGVVLAHEGIDGTIGAGNALMIARRNHSVIAEWYGRYRKFSDQIWNGFSVRLPMEMAVAHPGSVRLLDYTAFYWPPWNLWGVAQIYRAQRCILHGSYGVHLWETKMWASLLGKLTPADVQKGDYCFARLASAVLDGSYNFGPATLEPGAPAETVDRVLAQRDLASQLAHAPAGGEDAPRERPAQLASFQYVAGASDCRDRESMCGLWATSGECGRNAAFMRDACRKACRLCE